MTIQELLLKRFATKQFDPTRKVSDADLAYILECARLSCSSVNIQSWHITVVTNPELRTKLSEAAYNQPQVTQASHLLVLSAVKDPEQRIQTTAALISSAASPESAASYAAMAHGSVSANQASLLPWLQRQTYLALQAMILAAIDRGIDSCPMEGFNPQAFAELLGLTDVMPTALLTIGYASAPGFKKIRVPLEDIVSYRP